MFSVAAASFAQDSGRISGQVTRKDGGPVGGVVVSVNEVSLATLTDINGRYAFDGLAPGTYSLNFSAGESAEVEQNVTVTPGTTTTVDRAVEWNLSLAETITVYSASRRTERIVEAPAAVSTVPQQDIVTAAPTGQLPKVLESATGVDSTQSGLYDFNFNARGFNSSLNRRILTLIDGRDPSVPFLGAQEWAALSYPVDEMASIELVRGPGSALYGANAFSGVLNMTTKQPKYTPGGRVQLSGGDLNTQRIDVRHAAGIGAEWYYRVTGGYQKSDDFTRPRNAVADYGTLCAPRVQSTLAAPCLPREAVPLALEEDTIFFGGLRLDKHLASGSIVTIEAGMADLEGPTFQTGIGRVQVTDVQHPWARFNFNSNHWNFLTYYDARKAERQVALSSGAGLYEDSFNIHGELQGHTGFMSDRVRVVGGVAYNKQEVDTAGPNGRQTLMFEAHEEDQQAVFGQLEWDVTDQFRAVVAGRYVDSTLHEGRFSPKGSLVYSFTPNQSLRLSYNEAFQVPNYSEFFLAAPAGAPINLAAIEAAFAPALGGIALNFASVPIFARGNENLDVEDITSYEIGYSGIYGGKAFVTVDYYQNKVENFVTDLLPAVNPTYAPYQVPAGVNPAVAPQIIGALRQNLPAALFFAMTNDPFRDGRPAFVLSYTNAGKVDTQGIEVGMNYYLTNRWVFDANYSWFDFEVAEKALGDELLPNAPENKFNLGMGYRGPKFDASIKYRWVDDFQWAAGIFKGPVKSYDVVSIGGNYRFTDHIAAGVNVANAFDNDHWESWGGDVIERRALASLSLSW